MEKMISLQIGSNPAVRNVVWSSKTENKGRVQLALKSDVIGTAFPKNFREFCAASFSTSQDGIKTNKAEINRLSPNTEYVYRVVTDDGICSDIYSFKTHNFDGSFTFLLAGDPQLGTGNFDDGIARWTDSLVKGLEVSPDASFLISLGDQVDAVHKGEQFEAFFCPDILKSLTLAAVVGNHELGCEYSEHFIMPNLSEFGVSADVGNGSSDYWYIYNNVLFMALNSNNFNVKEHRQFMTETMSAHPFVRWNVVLMHHSPYCAAHAWQTCIPLRNELAPVFSELKIDVVLSAHDHAYLRTYMMDGTKPIITDDSMEDTEIINPDERQVLYISLNSSTGSVFFNFVDCDSSFVAFKNQEFLPNISTVSVTDKSFTVTTYRTNDVSVVDRFSVIKTK